MQSPNRPRPQEKYATAPFTCDWCDQSIESGDAYTTHEFNGCINYVHLFCYDDAETEWQYTLSLDHAQYPITG